MKRRTIIFFDAAFPPPFIGGKEKQAYLLAFALSNFRYNVVALTPLRNFFSFTFLYTDQNLIRISLPYPLLLICLIFLRLFSNLIHIHTPSRKGLLILITSKLLFYTTIFKLPNMFIIGQSKIYDFILTAFVDKLICLELNSYEYSIHLRSRFPSFLTSFQPILASNLVTQNSQIDISFPPPDCEVKLLFLARLVPQKNPLDLIQLAFHLNQISSSFRFRIIVVGSGSCYSSLREQSALSYSNVIFDFQGFQSDVMNYLINSHFLISLSSKEGMSNSILEALSIGLPILSTRVASYRHLLGKYSHVCTFECHDMKRLSSLIYYFISHPHKYHEFSKYLHSRSCIFSPNTIGSFYSDLYSS